jgi:hypothetical protein
MPEFGLDNICFDIRRLTKSRRTIPRIIAPGFCEFSVFLLLGFKFFIFSFVVNRARNFFDPVFQLFGAFVDSFDFTL